MQFLKLLVIGIMTLITGASAQETDCGVITTLHGQTQCLLNTFATQNLNDGMSSMSVYEGCTCYFCVSKRCDQAHEVVGPTTDMSFVLWIPDGYSYFCKTTEGCPVMVDGP